MKQAIVCPAEDRDAEFILGELAKAESAEAKAHGHYRAAGKRLLAKKATLGHGNWLPWLQENGIHPRKAQRCMAIAQGKNDSVSHLPAEPDPDAVRIGEAWARYLECQRDVLLGAKEILDTHPDYPDAPRLRRIIREGQEDIRLRLNDNGPWYTWYADVLFWPRKETPPGIEE